MDRFTHRAITFARGWAGSLADFKAAFESTHVFKKLPPRARQKEMAKVHRDLMKHTKENGRTPTTADESKEADASENK